MRKRKDYTVQQTAFQRRRAEFELSSKRCSSCRRSLPRAEFYKDRTRPDRVSGICRQCRSVHAKATNEHRSACRKARRKKLTLVKKQSNTNQSND